LFSEHQTSDLAVSDSELIDSIIAAKTASEVDWTLRQALEGKNISLSTTDRLDTQQWQKQSNGCQQHGDDNEFVSVVKGGVDNKLPFSQLSLNVSSAVLRRMAHVSVLEARSKVDNSNDANYVSNHESVLREEMLVDLLKTLGVRLVSAHKSSSRDQGQPQQRQLGVYPLSDILQALAVLAPNESTRQKMKPLATIVVDLLAGVDALELYKLGPIRLVQCLQAMAKLQIRHPALQQRIYERLLKPDAVSKLPARFLAHGLSSLACLEKTKTKHIGIQSDEHGGSEKERKQVKTLSRAFMRRLRKRKLSEDATIEDLCRALVATSNLLELGVMTEMEDEAAIFGFTSLRTILDREMASSSSLLNPSQVTDLISSWASLTDQRREDTVIEQLLEVCLENGILEGCNLYQLEVVTRSVQKLDMSSHVELTKGVGEQFLALVVSNSSKKYNDVSPMTTNEILRWPILAHRKNKEIMEAYLGAASLLFAEDSFLARCSVGDLANFLWFLSSAHTFNEKILEGIGSRLMEPEYVDACSPKLASRILATFTSLIESEKHSPTESLIQIKQDLFHNYGGHLLSSSLSPSEISSALYAYAKGNYLRDMGVFDHLVSLLAASRHECTVRQLSQSLWSCGKMMAWEGRELVQDETDQMSKAGPPYVANAENIAEELSTRLDELSPADIAQIVWAMGKLSIRDDLMHSRFARRAKELSACLNASMISNILWGLARVEYKNEEIITELTYRLASPDLQTSPKEAASVLFSLGRLNWRDETLFYQFSQKMVEQIEDTNAQSIANTLWAFRAVHLRPPQELLDTWAAEKLGLMSVTNSYGNIERRSEK